ncbi:MAG: aminotransferase class III-fold pyridoxal phosphate-dependent enzyme [Alphaproteobacteria bacterium]|nr:aminotransferase class III-fold pyridoxal phosphate-dependent enzyme [Alphaproteobacteria bacterium]
MSSEVLKPQTQNKKSYARSHAFLERSLKSIPLGSQTFSKSHIQLPEGCSPLYLERGYGSRVVDIDGNEFVDLLMALAPILLGYCDPDVDQAIKNQLEKGISFSMPTTLETELAERMIEMIPCAQAVRFGKNGSDATSAGIRLARAFTKRDKIIACGYHGWHDWYIGSTSRHLGVPQTTRDLTISIPYNNLDVLHQAFKDHPGEIAAMIMEPMNAEKPHDGYLQSVKEIVHQNGAVLIFDEVVTGFRHANGGAQELFGVTPDLAAFGKAMANGMPLSAITGRADIMALMTDIFFSGTFGGEALSLAASIAVVDKLRREPVVETIWEKGRSFQSKVNALIEKYELGAIFKMKGQPCFGVMAITPPEHVRLEAIRTVMLQKLIEHDFLTLGIFIMNYAFTPEDEAVAVHAFDKTFEHIAQELAYKPEEFEKRMDIKPIEPVFQVRKS